MLEDENGPLWYRGLSGDENPAPEETVDAILAQHGINHIVVGHTPTPAVILPRYDDRVVVIDTGMSAHYGGYPAYLEITSDGLFAGYTKGKIALPEKREGYIPYLEQVLAMYPQNGYVKKRLETLKNPPPPPEPAAEEVTEDSEQAEPVEVMPICGISQ